MSFELPCTYEAQYVSRTVGPALAKALAEIIEKRPADPVEYLGHFLHKFVENKKQQDNDIENAKLVEHQRIEKEEYERRQEEMNREVEELKAREEQIRKEKETEERRKKEAEELARRKEELANAAPALPSLTEEEDQIVEFGETKLHNLATTAGANLTIEIKENHNIIAARNKEFKTARDIARELNHEDNVKQIDEFLWELVAQENYKQLTDLVVLGFDDLIPIIEAKYGNADQMREKGLEKQAEQIFTVIPNLNAHLKAIKDHVEKGELEELKAKLDKKSLAYYRDLRGRTPLHTALEKKFLEMALFLINKFPLLAKLNDCFEKYPIDYYKKIDVAVLDEKNAALHADLQQKLSN